MSNGDNSNIIAARVARETFGVENVVARIYDPGRAEVYQRLGIPTVATVRWTADQILRRLLPTAPSRVARPDRRASYSRKCTSARGGSAARSRELEDASGARVAFVTRLGEAMLPDAKTVVQDGDLVHVVMRDADRRAVARIFAEGPEEARLCASRSPGPATSGARSPRELLGNGHEVLLIEKEARAAQGRQRAGSRVAARRRVRDLLARGGRTCDAARSSSPRPAMTRSTSSCRCSPRPSTRPRVVARVNHPKNEWLFNEAWGVDVAVSSPRLLSALVEEAVTVGDLVRLMTFQQGQANLVELTLPADTPLVGRAVGGVEWPRDTALVAILRGGRSRADGRRRAGGRRRAAVRRRLPEVEAEIEELLAGGRRLVALVAHVAQVVPGVVDQGPTVIAAQPTVRD